jgi:hypothetical protein
VTLALLAWLPLVFVGGFRACIEKQPLHSSKPDPSWISKSTDQAWRTLALKLVARTQTDRERLSRELTHETQLLPVGSVDAPTEREAEMTTAGLYGRLPEVMVDRELGAIFPVPVTPPARFSWYQISVRAGETLTSLRHFESGFKQWRALPPAKRVERFGEVSAAWDEIEEREATLTHHVRYLETWIPRLWRQWEHPEGGRPPAYVLTGAISLGDPRLMDPLREMMRPSRVVKRAFLPAELKPSKTPIPIPVTTDITDRRFIAEVEGALATHWNQSAWAKREGVRFKIVWTHVPRDTAFARGKITLEEHLKTFAPDRAALTTGGLSTYVHGNALVLGPGVINPRTLAHELGHLLGFADCYLRTLSSQGVLGTAILEWDNPLYPDDLMCDNTVGSPRAEVW